MKKTELHVVTIHDERSQTKVMKAITKLQGVDEISVNKEKRTLTIRGDVDPVKIVKEIRKTGHYAEIISVGPPEQPKPLEPPAKPVEKETPPLPPTLPQPPCYCNQCQLIAVAYAPPYDHNDVCSIM